MKIIAYFLIFFPAFVFANVPSNIPPGKWQCIAFDIKENSYFGVGPTIKLAAVDGIARCRHKSTLPRSCRVAQSFCELGPIAMGDTCLVTDGQGHSWDTTGVNACRAAMEMCTHFQWLYNLPTQCSVKHR